MNKEKFIFVKQKEDKIEVGNESSYNYWKDAIKRLRNNKVAMVSIIILGIMVVMALVGPSLNVFNHDDTNLMNTNQVPNLEHWFGTDELGRDLWCRIWVGARISLFIALVATLVQTFIGICIGGISGYFGGKIDSVIMRIADIVDSIPMLLYVVIIMMILGSGIFPIIIAFALTGWIKMARLVRGQALQLKERDYILASRGLGVSSFQIIKKHMVPNMVGVIIVTLTLNIPAAIFTEAYLSYVGIGIQSPLTSWGQLANAGALVLKTYPYQLTIPAFFISITMLALQLLGDGLRDSLDPKFRK